MTNSKEFLNAAMWVKKLKQSPNNNELLDLYKYYKQATVGDVNISKPGIFNLKDQAKWNSWDSVKGTDKHTSEVEYIKLVNQLIKSYGVNR